MTPATISSGSITWLALGDSYTIGEGVKEAERFPAQTAVLLRRQGIGMEDPVYIAATGWTTADLRAAIALRNPPETFDLVTLLIGVNDQYQGLEPGGYRTRFAQLLHKAVTLACNRTYRVFVLSIPDYSATPFVPAPEKERISRQIELFNAINKQITLENKSHYLDITPLTRAAAADLSLFTADGLHYAAREYGLWAGLLAPAMKEALTRS